MKQAECAAKWPIHSRFAGSCIRTPLATSTAFMYPSVQTRNALTHPQRQSVDSSWCPQPRRGFGAYAARWSVVKSPWQVSRLRYLQTVGSRIAVTSVVSGRLRFTPLFFTKPGVLFLFFLGRGWDLARVLKEAALCTHSGLKSDSS
ncbi:hypothetical protein CTA2_141 [Colletotrichum tanaceti]|nr:hypothetical protein CTA2_141 [Colletotrichum tanaceti]